MVKKTFFKYAQHPDLNLINLSLKVGLLVNFYKFITLFVLSLGFYVGNMYLLLFNRPIILSKIYVIVGIIFLSINIFLFLIHMGFVKAWVQRKYSDEIKGFLKLISITFSYILINLVFKIALSEFFYRTRVDREFLKNFFLGIRNYLTLNVFLIGVALSIASIYLIFYRFKTYSIAEYSIVLKKLYFTKSLKNEIDLKSSDFPRMSNGDKRLSAKETVEGIFNLDDKPYEIPVLDKESIEELKEDKTIDKNSKIKKVKYYKDEYDVKE